MAAAITCPNGVRGKAGGIVFLVHGTASDGNGTWATGPYNLILPTVGYDICWVTLPGYALSNAVKSAEYVAYNIKALAARSATKKVFVIGWSQGSGLNIQWALDFFPSTQSLVSGFFSITGDFHGSGPANIACPALTVAGLCPESVFQQMQSSEFLRAQNISGGVNLVPTTSIFSNKDLVIAPEPVDSTLNGASNILMQDLSACGIGYNVDHLSAPYDSGVFGFVLNALTNGGAADVSTFDKAYCKGFASSTVNLNVQQLASTLLAAAVNAAASVLGPNKQYLSKSEPLLPTYVCQRYPNSGFSCTADVVA
ncbi:alpha/beta-hydrolase [Athelia psychrophila]|uniref:Alpha/beta-hydrolase n=1 Tax=Athelia psychrophila TaxID=1759441 RepID=A0A166G6D0_9AGAM|nr:alpha/beta-hydrolase [Fibularhizoctonia sp. CBS 109695]